jgi:hypothetical protein
MRIQPNEIKKLALYRVYWKELEGGGSSVAAIGMRANGMLWIAPTNWTDPSDLTPELKEKIESLEILAEQGPQPPH